MVLTLDSVSAEVSLRFNRDIRPILSDHCYSCHGQDAHSRKAKLRFDQRDSALSSNPESPAIVPGKSGISQMIHRIFSTEKEEVMPPPEINKSLTAAEKKILVRWIDEGALYEKHWALKPLKGAASNCRKSRLGWNPSITSFSLQERMDFSPSVMAIENFDPP